MRTRSRNWWLGAALVVMMLATGVAFTYKIAEFIYTLGAEEVQGFADVPVTVYFVVAAGWMCLLAWCFLTGAFRGLEQAKFDILKQEDEYERRGE